MEDALTEVGIGLLQGEKQQFHALALGGVIFGAGAGDHRQCHTAGGTADISFLRVQQRADEGDTAIGQIRDGGETPDTSFKGEIHHKRLYRIVLVMPQRHLVAPLRFGFGVQGASAHFGAQGAGIALFSYIENDIGDLRMYRYIGDLQGSAKRLDRRKIHIGQSDVHRDGDKLEGLGVKRTEFCQRAQQNKGVLTARDPHGDAVALVDHVIIVHGAAEITDDLFDVDLVYIIHGQNPLKSIHCERKYLSRRKHRQGQIAVFSKYFMPHSGGMERHMATRIYIDQGHNPSSYNTGAAGNGFFEQDITYDIGVRLARLLESDGRFEVQLSRPTPQTILGTSNSSSLAERVRQANAFGASLFLSLHTNSVASPTPSGTEALVYSRTATVARSVAEDILEQLHLLTGLRNRGVKYRPDLYVLRRTVMPAVLVEMGFISNPYDAALMTDAPDLFSMGIYRGILQYYGYL